MGWDTVLGGIHDVLASNQGRAEQAVKIAELIRQQVSYRWVGLHGVTEQAITVTAWLPEPGHSRRGGRVVMGGGGYRSDPMIAYLRCRASSENAG